MNKTELVEAIAKSTGQAKSEVQKTVNALFETITKALKKGNKVTIVGFGTFDVVKLKARKGRNPQTGEVIKIGAKKVPKFRAGAVLKASVAGKKKK
jgi:nucleoid DNA-binding protein